MAEDKKEEKFDFTAEGEALGYISLDQARILAIRHARENTGFYLDTLGPSYSRVNFTWEALSLDESEDYFEVKLSFRPAGHYAGKPGIEQLIFDKLGNLEVRQILDEPSGLGASEAPINDLSMPALDDRTRQMSDRSTAPQGYSVRDLGRDPAAFISMGEMYLRMSEYEQAIEEYDKAIRVDSRNATAYNGRGAAYGQLGQLERAIEDFDESVRLVPKSAQAYVNRGGAYAGLGQFQQTIKDIDISLRFMRNDDAAYYHRGVAYARLDQPKRAIKDFNKAVRLKPNDNASAYCQRGAAYADLGQFQQAIKDSDEAVRQDPQDGVVFASRAYIYTLMGDQAEAQRDGDRALELGIEPEELKRSLAGINNEALGKKEGHEGHTEVAVDGRKVVGDLNLISLRRKVQVPHLWHRAILWMRRLPSIGLGLWSALLFTGVVLAFPVRALSASLFMVACVVTIVSGLLLWPLPKFRFSRWNGGIAAALAISGFLAFIVGRLLIPT